MIVISKTNSVFLAYFTFLVELICKFFKCIEIFLWTFIWTNKIFHSNGSSVSGFLFKIFINIAMAGNDFHSQVIHISFKLSIAHSPKYSLGSFKTFYLFIPIRS